MTIFAPMALRPYMILALLVLACQPPQSKGNAIRHTGQDTLVLHDTVWLRDTVHVYGMGSWQDDFGITHDPQLDSVWGHEVDHYISNPACDALAFDFYYGQFKPSDNALSTEFMELILSDQDELRPFYRWCFDRTIHMADGALAEYIGSYARQYVTRFPQEFLEYSASDSLIAQRWAEIIAYSGMREFQYDLEGAAAKIASAFKQGCAACPDSSLQSLDSFATLVVLKYEG